MSSTSIARFSDIDGGGRYRASLFRIVDRRHTQYMILQSVEGRMGKGFEMAKKSQVAEAQATLVQAAKTSSEGVRTLAGEALGAAAAAAANVVMNRVAQVLGKGGETVSNAAPVAQTAVQEAVVSAVGPSKKRRTAIKKKLASAKPRNAKKTPAKKLQKTAVKKKRSSSARKKR